MHHIAMGFSTDPSQKEQYWMRMFFQSVAQTLPCAECREHFQTLLDQHPPEVQNSCALQQWLFWIHNAVNHRLGKPQFTTDQYQRKYANAVRIHRDNREKKNYNHY
jgi:hypothetical protein